MVLRWALAVLILEVAVLTSAVVVPTLEVEVPGYPTPLREVEWVVYAKRAEAGGNTGEWAVCITMAGSTI